MEQPCPRSGKIYVLLIFCLVFTGLLISNMVVSKTESMIDDTLFGTGLAITVIQTIFTLYLIGIDLFGECSKFKGNIIKYTVILLSSSYMLSFGIINIFEKEPENHSDQQTMTSTLSIASFIAGVVGMLYIFSDIVCLVGCDF